MQIQSIFKTDKEREEAQAQLLSLKENESWKFLVDRVLKVFIEEFTENILNPDFQWREDELKEAKYNRKHWIELANLPEQILLTLIEPEKEEEKSDDPYFAKLKK